ncbi:MAG: LysR family transcriptional regulator [Streptosporangiales bacterium]|nr:LysR family transcriptional regulator [Streptosporangiales bacterium]
MIDLRRLHVLRAVAYYGTVTAAAQALHLTPSAASQQVRQVARELDVVLLEPHGRRVRLTPAAHSLLTHADAIEARWEQAESDLHAQRDQPAGLLRVCGFPVAISTLLAPLAATLRARHPQLTVRIQEVAERASFDLLFNRDVDLAIIEAAPDNPPMSDPRFDQQLLLDDLFDLVVPSRHPFAQRKHIALAEAAWEDWIVPAASCTSRTHTLAACSTAGFTPNITHHALEWSAIAGLIAHGLGVALIPRMADLAPHLPITRVPLNDDPSPGRKLLTCTRMGGRNHPATAAALNELHHAAPTTAARAERVDVRRTGDVGCCGLQDSDRRQG